MGETEWIHNELVLGRTDTHIEIHMGQNKGGEKTDYRLQTKSCRSNANTYTNTSETFGSFLGTLCIHAYNK